MKDILKIVGTSFLLLLLVAEVHAQTDAVSAIQKIYAAYNSDKAIHFNGSMKMYLKASPQKIIERMQSSYDLKGKSFACTIGPVAMLLNDNYYVSVDRSVKLIIIGNKTDLSGIDQIPVLNTDKFKKWISEKTIEASITPHGATSVLQLTDTQNISGYATYRIEYNTVSGYMKRVILEMAAYGDPSHKVMVLEIDYTSPVMTGQNKTLFSEKSFFSVINNKVQVTETYKNYELINQL